MTANTPAQLPVGFVEMMIQNGDKQVLEWLEASAPAEVYDLAQSLDTLRMYACQARQGGVDDWTLDPITDTLANAVNAMAELGPHFVDDFGIGHGREAEREDEPAGDPRLAQIIRAWPNLTPEDRADVARIVNAELAQAGKDA